MKIFNTLTEEKKNLSINTGTGENVCMRTYGLQSDPHWKCKTDDRIRYSTPLL